MFEESLLSARVAEHDRSVRITLLGSAMLQGVVAAGCVVYLAANPAMLPLAPAALRAPFW